MKSYFKLSYTVILVVFLVCLSFNFLTFAEGTSEKTNVAVAGGVDFTIALKSDGTVWTWGSNLKGQLGAGELQYSSLFQVKVISEVKAIAAGTYHSVALKSDGTVWTWGLNTRGQLGDGTNTNRTSPVQIKGLSDVTAIAAGLNSTIALKSDGTVWMCGCNGPVNWVNYSTGELFINGELINRKKTYILGDDYKNITDCSNIPVQIKGIADVQDIASGDNFILALCKDGTVWAWGDNIFGQLGDDKSIGRTVPEKIQGFDRVIEISSAGGHCIALKSDGTVWTWGSNLNYYDSLYINLRTWPSISSISEIRASKAPEKVGVISDVKAVAAGNNHYIALKKDGTVWTWGNGDKGQLGDGGYLKAGKYKQENIFYGSTRVVTDPDEHNVKIYPQQVKDVGNIIAISAGENSSYAIKNDGTLWAWGDNTTLKLGDPRSVRNGDPGQFIGMNLIVPTNTATSTPTPLTTPTPTPVNEITLQIDNPKMIVHGISKEIDPGKGTKPVIVNNRTLLPIRALVEALGGIVEWDSTQNKVSIDLNQKNIELWINSKETKVNGEQKTIEVAPQILNGRTMIPLRYVIENIGYNVEWKPNDRVIIIR